MPTKDNKEKAAAPMTKEQIANHPDNKIDMDHPGFPHGQSKENIISPKNEEDKKTAAVNITDGEKKLKKENMIDESGSDGSGGAFEASENVKE